MMDEISFPEKSYVFVFLRRSSKIEFPCFYYVFPATAKSRRFHKILKD
jgi:hypothetical protein